MASFKAVIIILVGISLYTCNNKDKKVEIYHMPPDYYYQNNWHDDSTQYTYTSWYALKHFDFNDSNDLAKVDSFVYLNYPIREKGRSIVTCVHFFKYSSKTNETKLHSLSSDRSLEIEHGYTTLLIYCYDERDKVPQWNRTMYNTQ